MYTWHIIDKTVAVRNAKQALADKVTIATLKSTVETQGKWIKAAEDAKIALIKQAAVAEQAAAEASLELEEYANNTTVNAQCAVDSNLVNRLRNR
ncbi:hypothetical protein [uncultured Paraglaciecola sp.]|uniref:hypothetical protein n=1 Tax=uncultured Paraglaciecola sp. TaxID=1765024 RepID=UPI002628DA10|nr:hypothetical protein [uncultured Paraglaciecola sp.]